MDLQLTPETTPVAHVGEILPNGAKVIAASSIKPAEDGTLAHGLVLAVADNGMFASWIYVLTKNSTSSGEYHHNLRPAMAAFEARCKKYDVSVICTDSK